MVIETCRTVRRNPARPRSGWTVSGLGSGIASRVSNRLYRKHRFQWYLSFGRSHRRCAALSVCAPSRSTIRTESYDMNAQVSIALKNISITELRRIIWRIISRDIDIVWRRRVWINSVSNSELLLLRIAVGEHIHIVMSDDGSGTVRNGPETLYYDPGGLGYFRQLPRNRKKHE
jgi:hypothetical protein